jgi:acyl carrier protein
MDEKVVIEIVAEALEVSPDRLTSSSRSEDIAEWDSLAHLRVCMAIEERFCVTIDMEQIPKLDSIPRLFDFLQP